MAVARILAVKQIFWEVFPWRITLERDKQVAETAVATITKPRMRGLLKSAIKRNIFTGLAISAASGIALKELVAEERKRKYAEYYRTHDAEKDFEEMRKKGVFQSC